MYYYKKGFYVIQLISNIPESYLELLSWVVVCGEGSVWLLKSINDPAQFHILNLLKCLNHNIF